jgi:hypothetical protein
MNVYVLHRISPLGESWTLGVWEDLAECQAHAAPNGTWERDRDRWRSKLESDGCSHLIEAKPYTRRGDHAEETH